MHDPPSKTRQNNGGGGHQLGSTCLCILACNHAGHTCRSFSKSSLSNPPFSSRIKYMQVQLVPSKWLAVGHSWLVGHCHEACPHGSFDGLAVYLVCCSCQSTSLVHWLMEHVKRLPAIGWCMMQAAAGCCAGLLEEGKAEFTCMWTCSAMKCCCLHLELCDLGEAGASTLR